MNFEPSVVAAATLLAVIIVLLHYVTLKKANRKLGRSHWVNLVFVVWHGLSMAVLVSSPRQMPVSYLAGISLLTSLGWWVMMSKRVASEVVSRLDK